MFFKQTDRIPYIVVIIPMISTIFSKKVSVDKWEKLNLFHFNMKQDVH